jgi:hypothetical protein
VNRTTLLASLLVLSLAANAAMLIAFAAWPALAPPEWAQVFAGQSARAASGPSGPAAKNSPSAPAPAKLWDRLQSGTADLRQLMVRLREAGFPPLVIRWVISALVDARIAQRSDELLGPAALLPYWKSDEFTGFDFFRDSKRSEIFNQLFRERSRQLRELLGDDATYATDPTAEQRRRFGDLSPAKIDAVQRIVDDYEEMMSQVRTAAGGVTLQEDREKLRLLENEKHADLAAVLTAQELEDYETRSHYLMWRLRGAMTLMDATEQEFRAIFAAQKSVEEQLRVMRPSDAQILSRSADQPGAPQAQMNQQLKAALGEQRFAEYSRAMNGEYQMLVRFTQRENLPIETAVRVFSLRDDVARESNRIYDDTGLTLAQKQIALQALGQQTRAQILSALGSTAGPAYAQTAARWLTTVERGGAVSFGPENQMTTRKLGDPPKK